MERNIERILREARYVLENKCTVREGAKKFGVSKSTFHADVTYKLKDVDKERCNALWITTFQSAI